MLRSLVTILFLCGTVSAQYLSMFNPAVNDARTRGMGHTETLNNTGPSALASNPANLAYVDRLTVEVFGRMNWGKSNGSGDNEYSPYAKLNSFAAARPFTLKQGKVEFTAGIIYNTYFDYGFNGSSEYPNYMDAEDMISLKSENRGGLNMLGIGAACALFERIKIGAAVHRSFFSEYRIYAHYSYSGTTTGYEYDWAKSETKTQSYFITLGQVWEFSERLSFGMMYRSDMRLKYREGHYERRQVDGDYEEGDISDSEYNIPSYIGAGVNYRPYEQLLLSAEYQNRPFAGIKGYSYYAWSFGDWDYSYFKQFSGSCYRLGMEIDNKYKWRLGIFGDNIMSLYTDSNYPGWEIGVDWGLGFNWRHFSWDFYAEYSTLRPNWPGDLDEDWFGVGISAAYSIEI